MTDTKRDIAQIVGRNVVHDLAGLTDEQRVFVLSALFLVYCRNCGRALNGQPCHCERDE